MKNFMTPEVREVVLSYMEALDCSSSLMVAILVRHDEWDQLSQREVDPAWYCDSNTYLRNVGAVDLLRKADFLDIPVDTAAAATEKWQWAEAQCFRTNLRLLPYLDQPDTLTGGRDERVVSFIDSVRKEVINLIGTHPSEYADGAFGPGATVSDVSRLTTVPDKMSSEPTFTPNSWPYLIDWSSNKWGWACAQLGLTARSVRGNEFFTVPKTSRTDRPCAKEPSINAFYQLALGRDMRRRLRRSGIDLELGQDEHRALAQKASIDDSLATIDLSSASDCVAATLVELLLPRAWFRALSALRSPFTKVNGRWYKLEKFSSMGNGFTFELETVIFTSIARVAGSNAYCSSAVSITGDKTPLFQARAYGDDIIVDSRTSENVLAALKFLGFTANPRKTFAKGSFRESCGGDFFDGMPVRAYFLKELPREPQDFIAMANGVTKFALQADSDTRSRLRRTWFRILDCIPYAIRQCRGPTRLGDLCIHDEERFWTTRWRSSIRYIKCYRPSNYRKVRWSGFAYDVQLAAALYGVSVMPIRSAGNPTRESERFLLPRDAVTGYKVGWLSSS